jgi:hypothetical protein
MRGRILTLAVGVTLASLAPAAVAQASTGVGALSAAPVAKASTRVTRNPSITVNDTGFGCGTSNTSTTDSINYIESYNQENSTSTTYSDMLMCAANLGPGQPVTHTEGAPDSCGLFGQSVSMSPYEATTYADGENFIVCNVPDDNGSGSANSEGSSYTFYSQSMPMEVPVYYGENDTLLKNTSSTDTVEFYQSYDDYNGRPADAITSAASGMVPAPFHVSSSIVTHTLGCSMPNPFKSGNVGGLGVEATYPDGQWTFVCHLPDYTG